VTTSSSFRRARSPEHKAERRETILSAAARLAARDGVRQVTLTDIAAAVGIHKSALLRYFETREQIFLELTGRAWTEWAAATRLALGEIGPDDLGDATADVLARGFAARPLLCDLIPHTALNLERHVSTQGVRAYKLTSLAAVEAVAAALQGPLPDLSAEDRRQLVSTTALLAGAMYQIATPPPPLAELYATDSGGPGRDRRDARAAAGQRLEPQLVRRPAAPPADLALIPYSAPVLCIRRRGLSRARRQLLLVAAALAVSLAVPALASAYTRGFDVTNASSLTMRLTSVTGFQYGIGAPATDTQVMLADHQHFEVTFEFADSNVGTVTYSLYRSDNTYVGQLKVQLTVVAIDGNSISSCSISQGSQSQYQCAAGGNAITLLDPPGTSYHVPAAERQAQATLLN